MANRAECVVFANYKGGTGKTTSCVNVAGYLAMSGRKVLVVDFDPQANATSGLGIDAMTLRCSMYDCILDQCDGQQGASIKDVILETDMENLHLAPSEIDLAVVEVFMQKTGNRTTLLSRAIEKVKPFYDFILVDLPPSSGLLTINGLCAADQVLVPVDPSIFALEALDNLKRSFQDIRRLARHSIHRTSAILVRYTKPGFFSRLAGEIHPSREIEARLRELFGQVFIVPESSEIYRAQKEGKPLSHFAARCKAGKAYRKIAEYIAKGD